MKATLTTFALGLMLGVSIATAADDPLPSWNDGPAKQSILAFVEKVTKEGSPDFVPVPERSPCLTTMARYGRSSRSIHRSSFSWIE